MELSVITLELHDITLKLRNITFELRDVTTKYFLVINSKAAPYKLQIMSRWTPRHSVLLSHLLDDIIGTQEAVEIRKDLCKLIDIVESAACGYNKYFTGSKAEGLDLSGSDIDYMRDIDVTHEMQIIEQGQAVPQSRRLNLFEMVTDNVKPAFAMLRNIPPVLHNNIIDSLQYVDGSYFLSSYLMLLTFKRDCPHKNVRIQGPSLEHSSNTDKVISIHCDFWPRIASEWVHRTRLHHWPDINVMNKIVDFGFHLVPIGYPRSPRSMMEWRISFSVAERLLVWSFNHTQIQMYAILKLILKEFIKEKCSAVNNVLCSYFIKTFLFWKYEETEKCFWRIENFRNCLRYLLEEFRNVLQCGILRHYFIRSFNLLEVKLTRDAQLELLQLYDMAMQYDVRIIGRCHTLKIIWERFSRNVNSMGNYQPCGNYNNCLGCNIPNRQFLMNSWFMMGYVSNKVEDSIYNRYGNSVRMVAAVNVSTDTASTPFTSLFVTRCHLLHSVPENISLLESNRYFYTLTRLFDNFSVDIATGKLWTAILFLMKADYNMTLTIINELLSSIPPYALYCSQGQVVSKKDTKVSYVGMFINSGLDHCQIATKAWLFDFCVPQHSTSIVPAAVQMELIHSPDGAINISPFTVAYYLQFLCYHGLRRYDNRDRALRQLVEVVDNSEQYGDNSIRHRSYNIAGHCLWFVGHTARARELFLRSCQVKMLDDRENGNENNAARHYLRSYMYEIDIELD